MARIETPTFIPSREIARSFEKRGYRLLASPTLYSGQTVRARVVAADANSDTLTVSLYAKHFNGTDDLSSLQSDPRELTPGQSAVLTWRVPDTHCYPIAQIGVQVTGNGGQAGTVLLDYLTWDGAPDVVLDRPAERERNRTTGLPARCCGKQRGSMALTAANALSTSTTGRNHTASSRTADAACLCRARANGQIIKSRRV
ncbi:hypothetical protein [Candidatus Flexifilum breve]|uniref:hypothetical protein n=1 Tax=Candidatus Flexifilum breve TaxID=3140694 RepID=UPI0031CC787B